MKRVLLLIMFLVLFSGCQNNVKTVNLNEVWGVNCTEINQLVSVAEPKMDIKLGGVCILACEGNLTVSDVREVKYECPEKGSILKCYCN